MLAPILPAAVSERLGRLAPDQRAAATASPDVPVLCVAPAGSGKTTTLVARIAWLISIGTDPGEICAITFNRRAAEELAGRLAEALAPLRVSPEAVRVRTFHALAREILAGAGVSVDSLVDRGAVLRQVMPGAGPSGWRRLDDAFSRLKLDLCVTADEVARDPSPGPVARAFLVYEAALAESGSLDFDDLVVRALALLQGDSATLAQWRRACGQLLVDEVQDVDRSQLRLALLLAAPANRIFLVGDDDQSIYGWRLADVRRILAIPAELPGLLRVDLETNYRCPAPVVGRAVRLVTKNAERFDKTIRASPAAKGQLILAPDGSDETMRIHRVFDRWPSDGSSRAVLARTNRELLPAAAIALDLGLAFRAERLVMPLEAPELDELLAEADRTTDPDHPLLVRLARLRAAIAARDARPDERSEDRSGGPGLEPAAADGPQSAFTRSELAAALLAWAAPYPDLATFTAAVQGRRARLAELRRADAPLTLATAHATKGLEFDHVAVIGLDERRFPSARAIEQSLEPERALEEERRLAYVAWTRARRTLTLVYDPDAPSPFMLEAFSEAELGLVRTSRRPTTARA